MHPYFHIILFLTKALVEVIYVFLVLAGLFFVVFFGESSFAVSLVFWEQQQVVCLRKSLKETLPGLRKLSLMLRKPNWSVSSYY